MSPVAGYTAGDGTSFSAPHVAGACALLIAAGAKRDPVTIKNYIQSTARPLDETPNPNGGNKYGAGLLDVYSALYKVLLTQQAVPFSVEFNEVLASQSTGTGQQFVLQRGVRAVLLQPWHLFCANHSGLSALLQRIDPNDC